jgi:hypothetical protein
MKTAIRSGVTRAVLFLALLFFFGTVMAQTSMSPVLSFEDFSDTGGKSFLTRTESMIVLTLEATGLVPGHAHTLWWVVFNNPANCIVANECGEADIFHENGDLNVEGVTAAEIAIGNATGNVAKSDGTLEFGARMVRGGDDFATGHEVIFPAGLEGNSLLTASSDNDAEVHLIVQSHGQARGNKQLIKQLSKLEYGCTPQCNDPQFAVHRP